MKYFKKPLPKFQNEEVWKELKRQCYDGTINYEDFPADEYKYFDRLRIIYLNFKFNGLPKEAATVQERALLKEYQRNKEKDSVTLKIYKKYQENIKRYYVLITAVNKAETPLEKLDPALEIIGLVTGDEGFYYRNSKRRNVEK